jgi:hypothetical protein
MALLLALGRVSRLTAVAIRHSAVTLNLFQGPVSSIADFFELDAETSSA